MFVLGVDPGLSRCGYAVLEPTGRGRARPVALGVIRTSPRDEVPDRLAELQRELRALFDEFPPVAVAVERIFAQQNLRTVIGVAQASGLALAEAASRGVAVAQYSPSAVKSVVTGDGRADKAQVQAMVRMLLGLAQDPRPADAADAAALALCHLAHDPRPGRTRRPAPGRAGPPGRVPAGHGPTTRGSAGQGPIAHGTTARGPAAGGVAATRRSVPGRPAERSS